MKNRWSQQLDKYRLDRCKILFTIPKMRRYEKIKQQTTRWSLRIWSQNLWLCYAVSMGKCILKTPKCNDTSYMGISQRHHRFCDESNISSQILWNFTESVMALCYSHVGNLIKFYYEHTITISQNLWNITDSVIL